jgi:hypothetical protein
MSQTWPKFWPKVFEKLGKTVGVFSKNSVKKLS